MRTELEIQNDLNAQLESYRSNVDKWTRTQIQESNEIVKSLQSELNDLYTEGAIVPSRIAPFVIGSIHGMKRGNGQYEVGCSIWVEKLGEKVVEGICSRGQSIEEAVRNWNNGKWQ